FKAEVPLAPENYLIGEHDAKLSSQIIEQLLESLESLSDFSSPAINELLKGFCAQQNLAAKNLFMPLRMIVSGKKASPPLFDTMAVLGKERCRTRLRAAINALSK